MFGQDVGWEPAWNQNKLLWFLLMRNVGARSPLQTGDCLFGLVITQSTLVGLAPTEVRAL